MSKSKNTTSRSLLGRSRQMGRGISCLGVVAVTLLGATAQAQDVDAELDALEQETEAAVEAPAAVEADGGAASEEADAVEEETTEEEAAAPAAAEEDGLDEVVVTVDRRKKRLQDYSGIASAFSEDKLSSMGINNVRELSQMVPGLQIGTQESGTTVYIRGIGSDNNTELGDPAVAVHMDGVYLPRSRGMGSAFFDIERVEVNSGPQGTLRGRNAVGGSINIVSKQPKLGTYEASASATFGSYDLRRYQGMVNIPFGETAAFRVAGQSNTHDSYWENAGPVNHIPGAQNADDYALRATFLWKPTEKMSVTLGYDLLTESGTGYLGANMQQLLIRQTDDEVPLPDPYDVENIENPRRVALRGRVPNQDLVHQGGRLHMDYDMGPAVVEFSGSYRDLVYKQYNGSNAGAVVPDVGIDRNMDNWSGANQWDNRSKSTTLELRAYAPDDARLQWSAGAFYFYEDQGAFLGQMREPFAGYGGGEFNMPHTIGRSYAGFADGTFKVTDDFRIIAGARYSNDHKDRLDGLWALWVGLDAGDTSNIGLSPRAGAENRTDFGRFGTEGFSYKGYDRQDYDLPADALAEERVNFFLDGIESFGARDEVPIALCNDVPDDADGDAGERLFVNDDGNLRCTAGVRDSVSDGIFTAVAQNNEVDTPYIDFRAGFEYDLAKDNMVYATLTSGHKAAGFNDTQQVVAGEPLFNSEYGQETVYSVEAGAKLLMLNRKLKIHAAAFGFSYGGMQFQTIVQVGDPPPIDPLTNMIRIDPSTDLPFVDNRAGTAVRQNAPVDTLVYGLDLDIIYSLPAGLEAEVHALLMDARFSDGTYVNDSRLNLGSTNAQVDLGGNWLPRASPFTLNYALSQVFFTDAGQLDWQVQGQTRGKHYMTVFNGEGDGFVKRGPEWDTDAIDDNDGYNGLVANPARLLDRVNTYTTVNAGIGWRHPDGRLSIRGYVNNVFNTNYANTIIATGGLNLRFYNNQRMGGVTVRMDW